MITGTQVDAWSAFIPNRKDLAGPIHKGVYQEVLDRKLPNLFITQGDMTMSGNNVSILSGDRRYLFYKQQLNSTAMAIVALRVAPRGANDLEVSWRLIESDLTKSFYLGMSQTGLIGFGIFLIIFGCPLIFVGVGECLIAIGTWMIGVGLGWWGLTKNKSRLSTDQMLDARLLAQTIHYCLMLQLDKLGVSSSEIKVLQASQMEGIGNLGGKKNSM